MQVYLVQAVYTDDEGTKTKSILVVYKEGFNAHRMVELLQKNFKPNSEAIKAEYSVLAFEVL